MNTALFLLSLLIAVIGPVLAISYLRPILLKVLQSLCNAEGGAEFWLRSAYLLAVCGTLLLMLSFGQFEEGVSAVETMRRALWLVLLGVFATVALISQQVWRQVRALLVSGVQPEPATSGATSKAPLTSQDGIVWPSEGNPS
jgi:hypothetical protein